MPYTWSIRMHPSNIFLVRIFLWLRLVRLKIRDVPLLEVAHLAPRGASSELARVLAVVERVSCIIRPLTLRVRLCINIIAGHILVSLVAGAGVFSFGVGVIFFLVCVILMVLETAVSFVQAYVFCKLYTLYV